MSKTLVKSIPKNIPKPEPVEKHAAGTAIPAPAKSREFLDLENTSIKNLVRELDDEVLKTKFALSDIFHPGYTPNGEKEFTFKPEFKNKNAALFNNADVQNGIYGAYVLFKGSVAEYVGVSHNVIRKLKQQFYSRRISQASFAYARYQTEIEKVPREDDKRKTYKDRIEAEDLLKKIQDKMKFYKILIIPVNSLNGAEL
ncbi:MAG: hypothetical protein JNM63_17545, partial [Spirochaetia bacterium]|nr:hypothetical protein [Spirochaetia bacterium]